MEGEQHSPTTRQVIIFTVVLSFIVSMIGTVLALGVFGPVLGVGEVASGPFLFSRPLEKVIETVTEKETTERIFREDELVVQVVENASPAVVSVIATKDVPIIERYYVDPFAGDSSFGGDSGFRIPQFRQKGTQTEEVSSGTGFLVSPDGLLVTNRHVVSDSEAAYTVLLNDGSKKSAEVLARDPLNDLAVLKIEGAEYPFLPLGDSAGIKIGQSVIAIGNALGEFRNTVSLGVVSGLHRTIVTTGGGSGAETLQELIQTDAAINPGNSGGPLLNIRGEVIGINTAVAAGAENIGFALPIDAVKHSIESVKAVGRIVYPYLGVRYILITKDFAETQKLARDYGAYIQKGEGDPAVAPGSPAEKAGLKEGDIILEINGRRVAPENTLAAILQKFKVGDEITLKVFRDGNEIEVKAKLEERK